MMKTFLLYLIELHKNFSFNQEKKLNKIYKKYFNQFKHIFKLFSPIKTRTFDDIVDKYVLIKPNHTYFREWNLNKFFGGFGLTYLFLREVII